MYANVTSVKGFMWFVCANIIAFYGLFEMIFHGKTSAKGWKNLREMLSSNFRTAAGKQHRGIEVSDEDKHLRWSHDF